MHSMGTTYPMSFGLKEKNYQIVEELMLNEMKELSSADSNTMFYHKGTNSMVRVHFELLLSLQDQPERRSCSGLMYGSGTYSARWGYSCNFIEIQRNIVSCKSCLHSLLCSDISHNFSNCTNWELVNSDSTLLEYEPPKHYPRDSAYLNRNGKLVPMKLSLNY